MRNWQPDMVPVGGDTSNTVRCRLTGKPFRDIYHHQDPLLGQAYAACARQFGFDGWLPALGAQAPSRNAAIVETRRPEPSDYERLVAELEAARDTTHLPERATGRPELRDLLARVRLATRRRWSGAS